MNPDVSYEQLVDFVGRVASVRYNNPNTMPSYGPASDQLLHLARRVQELESQIIAIDPLINQARMMLTHRGNLDGTIKRPSKTNTLTAGRLG